jgi:hypothetical protein
MCILLLPAKTEKWAVLPHQRSCSPLTDSVDSYYKSGEWTWEKTERSIIEFVQKAKEIWS